MKDKIKEHIKEILNAEVLDIQPTSGGYSHEMYLLKINKAPHELLIRFSNNSEKPERDLKKELWVLKQLRKINIPVAEIYHFKERENENSHDIMLMEKLSGNRLDLIWEKLSQNEREQITEEIGKLAKKIHSIKLEAFGRLKAEGEIEIDKPFKFKKAGEKKPHNEFIRNLLKEHLKNLGRLLSFEHVEKDFIKNVFNYIIENKENINYKGKPILIHGDLVPQHIFVRKEDNFWKITGLIDIEFSEPSCPEFDFIKLHRAGFFDSKELKEALIKGYGQINEKAVEVLRTIRDSAFLQVLLESGDNEEAEKVLKSIEKTITS